MSGWNDTEERAITVLNDKRSYLPNGKTDFPIVLIPLEILFLLTIESTFPLYVPQFGTKF